LQPSSLPYLHLFSHIPRPLSISPLLPYTTLFRSICRTFISRVYPLFICKTFISRVYPLFICRTFISRVYLYLSAKHLFPESTLRSEEHTSELQSRFDLVSLLLPKKKNSTYLISYA